MVRGNGKELAQLRVGKCQDGSFGTQTVKLPGDRSRPLHVSQAKPILGIDRNSQTLFCFHRALLATKGKVLSKIQINKGQMILTISTGAD
jgi:hypothetical protein